MRDGFKAGILSRAELDESFHVLTGDHGYALFDEFASKFPKRFHNVGVAESNLIGLAAGMARSGIKPLVYGLAAFIPNRVFEFIKLQIVADNLPVTLVGDGAGLVYSTLGISHQTLEDLAIIGSLPTVTCFAPASDLEMNVAVKWASKINGPTYIRMGKSDGIYEGSHPDDAPSPQLTDSRARNTSRAIVAHGSMVSQVMGWDSEIRESFDLWSCPTVSHIPSSFIEHLVKNYKEVVVVEEHGIHGGLGSRILHAIGNTGPKIHLIGASLQDSRSVGTWNWALKAHRLDQGSLIQKLREIQFLQP
jgi:transketolase